MTARSLLRRLSEHLPGKQHVIERTLIEYEAPPEEVAAVQEALASFGFSVTVRPEYPLTGGPPTDLSWAVFIALGVPLTAFFTALGSAAGTDAYAALKEWVERVRDARRLTSGRGEIRIHDAHTSMVIPADIPDEAIDALRDVDWAGLRGGHLVWVEEQQVWRDTRDLVE
jgi:hypothetical protein